MENIYTTASDGLDPTGWYPGKKYGFLKNLGRVTSMGIYNPDNRMASKLNIQKLEARGQHQEDLRGMKEKMKELHNLALESLHDYYTKAMPDKSPAEIAQMTAQHYASKFLSETSKNNAEGAKAEVDKETSKGLLPGAAGAATKGQMAAEAAADASTARNRNVEANERGRAPHEMDAGAREIMSQIDLSGAKSAEAGAQTAEAGNRKDKAVAAHKFNTPYKAAQYDDINIDADTQKAIHLKSDEDWQHNVKNQLRPIVASTMQDDAQRQAMDAINNRLESTSMNKALMNPTTADSLTAARLNKNSMTVPYGGTVVPVVPVDQSNVIQGETRHPEQTTTTVKVDPVTGKPIPVTTHRYYGTNQPPTTAEQFNGLTGRRQPITVDTNLLNSIRGGR